MAKILHSPFKIQNRLIVPVQFVVNGEVLTDVPALSTIDFNKSSLPIGSLIISFLGPGGYPISTKKYIGRLDVPNHLEVAVVKGYYDGVITPSVNTVQGLSWVHIHNFLTVPLTFTLMNKVPLFTVYPGEPVRFVGEKGMGVPFGTFLYNELLGKLMITRRISDIIIM